MRILGIESSCDETAAAVISSDRQILSNVVRSQLKEHAAYGGVVPEIASRAHIMHVEQVILQALRDADMTARDIDAIAATAGPGLIGGVIVGLMTAKGMALALNKPLVAVNHLEGHALTSRLTNDVPFPFLLLLVSGGHCQILSVADPGQYRILGKTLDDAVGEAFDKTAKMLGLGYPGGPVIEKMAAQGNPERFTFPQPLVGREGCDFSFSGLKTSVLRTVEHLREQSALDDTAAHDVCASFQATCGTILADRMTQGIRMFKQMHPEGKHVVVAGGVAANHYLRAYLGNACERSGMELVAPPMKLCTDNAAMIAWAGIERLNAGLPADGLDVTPRARWPLDNNTR
ncbi:MAG: tRNA (adenosine(37)-N6)-threonylcarbamoyltransferase complex transferase subunit TsaD [Hyphomicrobiales bacterium]|nr:tRNA (adenosine(37)-N6)-threonylcarbamoyltransferase complex transferase subunit TsaD [Rickettsiales bacterium]MCP5361322.1 tRNA (adenosine(37)-N6)-threonylcarbamoyltransferase complex transferase subunit TsaD [Hyphomicrobiales bacterium]